MAPKDDATRVKDLQLEIDDLKSGRSSHMHTPRDGSAPFRCTSPYCEDLGSEIPATSPAGREDPDKYRRNVA